MMGSFEAIIDDYKLLIFFAKLSILDNYRVPSFASEKYNSQYFLNYSLNFDEVP